MKILIQLYGTRESVVVHCVMHCRPLVVHGFFWHWHISSDIPHNILLQQSASENLSSIDIAVNVHEIL